MDNFFFVGGLFPKETEALIRANTIKFLQNAANNLQWKFIDGFEANEPNKLKILNSVYVGSFPHKYRRWVVKGGEFSHGSQVTDVDTEFVNLPIIKEFSRMRGLKRAVKEAVHLVKPGSTASFIGYAATFPIVEALIFAKRICPDAVCCLIVPDMPRYMNLSSNAAGLLTRAKNMLVEHRLKRMDCYVLLTEFMAKELGIVGKPSIVIEGIADEGGAERITQKVSDSHTKTVLYTGTLQYKYGVGDLLHAFQAIDAPDIKLMICGEGEAEPEILSASEEDERIEFLGVLSSDKVKQLQQSAFILVNPRRNDLEFAKYSFPSKMMEYLSSGRPVLAFPLDGIPDEYSQYYLNIDDSGLEVCLRKALEKDPADLEELGARARKFVNEEKNSRIQTAKVIDLINEVCRGEGC